MSSEAGRKEAQGEAQRINTALTWPCYLVTTLCLAEEVQTSGWICGRVESIDALRNHITVVALKLTIPLQGPDTRLVGVDLQKGPEMRPVKKVLASGKDYMFRSLGTHLALQADSRGKCRLDEEECRGREELKSNLESDDQFDGEAPHGPTGE